MIEYNFKKDYAVKCINANKHNHVTTTYYLLLKRKEQLGEVSEKDFEYYDDKKIQALAIMERPKSSTQAHAKSDNLNLTVPVKKEDLSLLEIKQEK